MSRPSASGLRISMVWPDMLVHFHRQLPFAPELDRSLRQVRRRTDVRRQIAEVPRERHAGCDGAPFAHAALNGGGVALGNSRNGDMSERPFFRFLALHAVEAVGNL